MGWPNDVRAPGSKPPTGVLPLSRTSWCVNCVALPERFQLVGQKRNQQRTPTASINPILRVVLQAGNAVDPSGFAAPGNNKLGKVAFLLTSEPSETRFPLRWHRHLRTHPLGIVRALVPWRRGAEAPVRQTQIASRSPAVSRRFGTTSMPNVLRSISQESIIGSRKEMQFSTETLKTSVSRNSRMATRICS